MSLFEVLSPFPQKIDMGGDLPLRFSTRPLLGRVVWPLLTLTLFGVVPLAFILDQGVTLAALLESWWQLVVVILGTLVGGGLTVRCILTRLEVEVTRTEVSVRGAGALSAATWREPLEHYVALDCERHHHPDWIGAQDEYGICLRHRDVEQRSVFLHWGRNAQRFEERLTRYAQLLGLRIRREQRAPAAKDGSQPLRGSGRRSG